jgi:hypothetical protein
MLKVDMRVAIETNKLVELMYKRNITWSTQANSLGSENLVVYGVHLRPSTPYLGR